MPRTTYTTDQKMAALVELERCRGDILRASLNTGIPERTLYTWRRRFYAENKQQQTPAPPPLLKGLPTFGNDAETLAYVRQQMMSQLVRLVSTFQEDNAIATPQQRALALTQLIDRLIKLDHHLDPYMPNALYQFPDEEQSIFAYPRTEGLSEDEDNESEDDEEDIDAHAFKYPASKTEASLPPSSIKILWG